MIEVEVKYRLKDRGELIKKLHQAGYKKAKTLHQVDEVFLIKGNSLKDFRVGDPVTRIRTVNDLKTLLTYKRAIDTHDVRVEHEMEVRPAGAARALLSELDYHMVATVDKVRVEYKQKETTVTIDQVKGLGYFAEVEIVCKEGDHASALVRVKKIAQSLGLRAKDVEPLKYDQLVAKS